MERLDNVAEIIMGQSPSGKTYNKLGEGLPLLNGPTEFGFSHPYSTLYTSDSKKESMVDDLIFCVRGSTTGRMNWSDKVYSLGRGVCAIRGETNSDTKYIRYCIEASLPSLLKQASGSTFPNLSNSILSQFCIPWIEDRESVSAFISSIDNLIYNNKARITLLEEMAQTIYTEWFVNFEENIPSGWSVSRVSSMCEVFRGKSYKSSELSEDDGLQFVNLKCLNRGGGFRKSGLKRFTGKYKEDQQVKEGDIVMAVTDMTQDRAVIARAARVPSLEDDGGVISMDLVKIQANEGVNSDYLYSLLRWSDFPDNVKNHANGANVLHLSPDRIKEYEVMVADKKTRDAFGELVGPMFDLVNKLESENEVLTQTRDLLIPKLVTGEVEIKA